MSKRSGASDTGSSRSMTRAPIVPSTLRASACAHTAPNMPVEAPTTATGAGRRFGAPQDVSPPGIEAWIGDLAAARDGRALVTWTAGTGDELAGQIQAALAPAGAPFGPPELVSALQEARLPAAAFDPVSGRPTIVWSNRPEGSARPIDEIETFAEAATRGL